MEAKSIRLRIYGQEYPLRVDNEDVTTRSAKRLDAMMAQLHSQIPEQPPVTLAVLSALNFAEDLYHEQEEKRTILNELEQELRSLTSVLDDALNGS
jgi:cell division protein ZapA